MKYIVTTVILLYLLIQSISDLKEMKVYTTLNNLCLAFSVFIFLLNKTPITALTIIIPTLLMIAHLVFGAYGSGDIKAFLSVFLVTTPFIFVCFLFLTSIIFLIFIPKKNGKGPLFPAMFIAYLISSILLI